MYDGFCCDIRKHTFCFTQSHAYHSIDSVKCSNNIFVSLFIQKTPRLFWYNYIAEFDIFVSGIISHICYSNTYSHIERRWEIETVIGSYYFGKVGEERKAHYHTQKTFLGAQKLPVELENLKNENK
ncbi:hypothetical protein A3842_09080 [Paenibacillus sp. P3E]|nr:hypothetical protein A3842_09080 [Paenibacillus sp. P3E]